jgi:hypothetical protein
MKIICTALLALALTLPAMGQSIDIGPLSLGNSSHHTGLRINARDNNVREVRGINLTLWKAKENKWARLSGVALGIVGPEAGDISSRPKEIVNFLPLIHR